MIWKIFKGIDRPILADRWVVPTSHPSRLLKIFDNVNVKILICQVLHLLIGATQHFPKRKRMRADDLKLSIDVSTDDFNRENNKVQETERQRSNESLSVSLDLTRADDWYQFDNYLNETDDRFVIINDFSHVDRLMKKKILYLTFSQ